MMMIGDRIRSLREARSWTQAHLAEASGVSLRTIQRLERLHSCSAETLLALAAALDVDVREITEETVTDRPAKQPRSNWLTQRRAAAWSALLAAPVIVFVAVNLLRSGLGLSAPYDQLASVGSQLGLAKPFEAASPFLFVGGALAAIALTVSAQVRPIIAITGRELSLTGIKLRFHAASAAVLLVAFAALATLGMYLIAENLGELLGATNGS